MDSGVAHPNELEQVLVNRLSTWNSKDGAIFQFLASIKNRLAKQSTLSPKLTEECNYFVSSYAGIILVMPSMFEQPQHVIDLGPGLLPKLIIEGQDWVALASDLIKRYEEDDLFPELLEGIFKYFMEVFQKQKLLDPSGSLFSALEFFTSHKSVSLNLVKSKIWWSDNLEAINIGKETFLGSIFSVIPDSRLLSELLPFGTQSNPSQINNAYTSSRMAVQSLVTQIHGFLYKLIKLDPAVRDAVIEFFVSVAILNGNRAKMHVDYKTVTPDGIVLNMFMVLLKFSEPFLGPKNAKADLIEENYYELCSRISIENVTKINMEDRDYLTWKSAILLDNSKKKPNFISDIFYLTVQYFRIGVVSQINLIEKLVRNQRELSEQIDRMKKELENNLNSPMKIMHEQFLKRAQTQLKLFEDSIRINEIVLLDQEFIESSYLFTTLMLTWMLRLAKADPSGQYIFLCV